MVAVIPVSLMGHVAQKFSASSICANRWVGLKSEQLRGFVLWGKSSLGSQSARGDRFAANLKSVVHPCRKQQRHVFSYLVEALHAAFNHRSAPSLLPAP